MARIDDVRELAEKVMGWTPAGEIHEAYKYTDHRGVWRWVYKNGKYGRGFEPDSDPSTALEVAGAMRVKYRLNLTVHDIGGGQFAAVFSGVHCSRRGHFSEGTFCEAICGAALAAVRAQQEER